VQRITLVAVALKVIHACSGQSFVRFANESAVCNDVLI
jgi:hypothetical protein